MHAAARNSDRSIGELIGWVIAWYVAIGIFSFPLDLGLLQPLVMKRVDGDGSAGDVSFTECVTPQEGR